MPDATITSTASTFGTISGTFAADQSTVTGTISGVITGTLTGSVGVPGVGVPVGGTTGQVLAKTSGTDYATGWTTPSGGAWGSITGTLSNQTDLNTALTGKLAKAGDTFTGNLQSTNGSGVYLSNVGPSYLYANHGNTYSQYINGGPGGNSLTVEWDGITFASGKQTVHYPGAATLFTSPVLTGDPTAPTPATSDNDTSIATTAFVKAQGYLTSAPVTSVAGRTGAITLANTDISGLGTMSTATASDYSTTTVANGLYYPLSGNPSSFLVAADIAGKADLASPAFTGNVTITSSTGAALFITQTGTGNILTLHDQASDTTFVAIDANGKVNTIASEATNGAGFNVPHGVAPTTPVNGDIWTTTSGLFARINAGTQQFAALSTNNTFSNASSTYGSSTATGTINVASGATISASTKTVNVATGGVSGSTTNTTIGPVLGASTTSIGGTTAASTLNLATGATLTATTKAVNIGTSGVAGSTTNIAIGSTTGTSTTTLQGATNGVTQTAGNSTTLLATTAFVTTADNLKANLASPTFTGTPTLPTGTIATTQTAGNNTTAVATTAFVTAAIPSFGVTADINDPVSTTRAASIDNVRDILMSNGYQLLYQGAGSTGTSGTGAAVNNNGGRWKEYVSANSAVAGHAKGVYDTPAASIGIAGYQRGANLTSRNWSKKVWMTGRCMIGHFSLSTYNGSANTWARVTLGGYTAIGAGDMSASNRGIGWRVQGGGTSALELQVSNGTTVTTITSSFTPTLQQCFDWEIYSDGAGNVTLFVNDSQVATTNAGPTGTQTSGLYMEGVDSTASSTAAFILNNLGTKIFFAI